MLEPIDFYFDFSSPYGYFASEKIDALARHYDRQVNWHPILLGVIFKITGVVPLPLLPLKGDYARQDMPRTARYLELPFRYPSRLPIPTVGAVRGYYWLAARDPGLARDYAHACYRAFFVDDIDISQTAALQGVVARLGIDPDEFAAAIETPPVKDLARAATDAAIARGVFGSPTLAVSDQLFWGTDRMGQLERWLATGGF